MNVFGIGLPEMALILVIALLVFGPKKLPEIGRSMGKAIRGFQDASREFESEFKREAEHLEQVVKTPSLPEPREVTIEEAATAESKNNAATSSTQT
jgi:sec-independent protein translocase protein TatA